MKEDTNELLNENVSRQQRRIDAVIDFILICIGTVVLVFIFKFCSWIISL